MKARWQNGWFDALVAAAFVLALVAVISATVVVALMVL